MNTKQLQGISIAAILSLSVLSTGGISLASADPEFSNIHFKSAKCRLADPTYKDAVEEQLGIKVKADGTLAGADCSVKAWFDESGTSLKYQIKIVGMEVIDTDSNPENDVAKMHFHKAGEFVNNNPDNPKGPNHILNIWQTPSMDDDDLQVNPMAGLFTGIWDESDTNLAGDPDSTYDITEQATQEILCQGEAFLMVHGNYDGLLPGFIKASIQPTPSGIAYCEANGISTESDLLS